MIAISKAANIYLKTVRSYQELSVG